MRPAHSPLRVARGPDQGRYARRSIMHTVCNESAGLAMSVHASGPNDAVGGKEYAAGGWLCAVIRGSLRCRGIALIPCAPCSFASHHSVGSA
jgi:hypothetical protein